MTTLGLEIFDRFKEKVLRRLRELKGAGEWNAALMAEECGLSVQSIYSLAGGLRGKQIVYDTTFKLAKALGWSMDDILDELFPDKAGVVYRLVRERPKVLDHLAIILDKGGEGDLEKIERDLEYIALKLQ